MTSPGKGGWGGGQIWDQSSARVAALFTPAAQGDLKKLLSHLCFLEGNSESGVLLKLAAPDQASVCPVKPPFRLITSSTLGFTPLQHRT